MHSKESRKHKHYGWCQSGRPLATFNDAGLTACAVFAIPASLQTEPRWLALPVRFTSPFVIYDENMSAANEHPSNARCASYSSPKSAELFIMMQTMSLSLTNERVPQTSPLFTSARLFHVHWKRHALGSASLNQFCNKNCQLKALSRVQTNRIFVILRRCINVYGRQYFASWSNNIG